VKINGTTHYLWRAVDQHGDVLDILVRRPLSSLRKNRLAATALRRDCMKPGMVHGSTEPRARRDRATAVSSRDACPPTWATVQDR
jgi:transposase-like protein